LGGIILILDQIQHARLSGKPGDDGIWQLSGKHQKINQKSWKCWGKILSVKIVVNFMFVSTLVFRRIDTSSI